MKNMIYSSNTLKIGDHDNKEGLLLQINHFYSHLQIFHAEQAIAALNNGDKLDALAVIMKLMHKKSLIWRRYEVEKLRNCAIRTSTFTIDFTISHEPLAVSYQP